MDISKLQEGNIVCGGHGCGEVIDVGENGVDIRLIAESEFDLRFTDTQDSNLGDEYFEADEFPVAREVFQEVFQTEQELASAMINNISSFCYCLNTDWVIKYQAGGLWEHAHTHTVAAESFSLIEKYVKPRCLAKFGRALIEFEMCENHGRPQERCQKVEF